MKTEFRTFMELAAGGLAVTEALRRGLITFEGGSSNDPDVLFELFSVSPAELPVDLMAEAV